MSNMVQCDKCHKTMYADSRSSRGDYALMRIEYVDGCYALHLCKECHRQLLTEFMRIYTAEEYDEQYGSWWK